jgi:uncharacterized membrane protein
VDEANDTGSEEVDGDGPPAFAWTEVQSELGLVVVLFLVYVLVEIGVSAGWTLVLVVALVVVVFPVVVIVVVSDVTEELGAEPL